MLATLPLVPAFIGARSLNLPQQSVKARWRNVVHHTHHTFTTSIFLPPQHSRILIRDDLGDAGGQQEEEAPARMGRQPKNVKLSAAEARVVLLALAMVGLGIAVFFILSITVVQPLLNGRGSTEANCTVISAEIPKWIDCAFECGPYCKGVSSYPCLQVYVNVTPWGRKVLLHRDEQSISSSSQCYQLTKCYRDHADATAVIEPLKSSFRALNRTPFRCFYNARVHHDDALFSRSASDSESLLQWLLWPLLAVAIGAALLFLLALSHTLAGVCENKQTIQHRRKAQSDTERPVARRPWRSNVADGGGGGSGRSKSRASLRSAGIAIVSFRAVGNSLKGEKHVHLP